MNSARVNRCARAGLVLLSLVAGAASLSSAAHAQAWLPDRNYTEGPGIRVGDLEVHPGVAVRGGYDNNVFRGDGKFQPREGSGILAVTPHVHLSTLTAQRKAEGEDRGDTNQPLPTVQFRTGLSATYFHYFLDGGPKNLEVDSDVWVGILPKRPVNFEFAAAYLRNVRPFTQRAQSRNSKTYIYDTIAPAARMNFGSRSQVLTGFISYAPRISLFESNTFNYLNNFQHGVLVGASWRFLPSTALIYDADVGLQRFQKELNETSSPVVLSDNNRFRTRIGLNGALTRKIALRALVGYAVGFYENPALDDYEDVVGEAALTYRFGAMDASTFAVGYQRDVQAGALGGWLRLDRGYANLSALIGRAFQLTLEAGAGYITYGQLIGRAAAPGNNPYFGLGQNNDRSRNDVRLDGAVRGEYRVTNWLAFTGDFTVQALLTDFEYSNSLQGTALPDPARFYSLAAFGGVRAHY